MKLAADYRLKLLKKLGVSPQDNDISKKISADAKLLRAKFLKLKGKSFDLAYAKNELAYHQFVNKSLRELLIPNTKNSELKELLKTGLRTFTIHEEHAQHMVEKLEPKHNY